jgi:hypothetical protein
MDRLVKSYIPRIVHEINQQFPGPLRRIISGYLSEQRYTINGRVLEIPDIELLISFITKIKRGQRNQPRKFWTWSLMKQLSWIDQRIIKRYGMSCMRCEWSGIVVRANSYRFDYNFVFAICDGCMKLEYYPTILIRYI